MINQLQCPSCHFYKISRSESIVDARNGQTLPPFTIKSNVSLFYGIVLFILLPLILTITGILVLHYDSYPDAWAGLWPLGIGLVSLIVVSITATNALVRKLKGLSPPERPKPVRLYSFECNSCGKHWTWREDQPYSYP